MLGGGVSMAGLTSPLPSSRHRCRPEGPVQPAGTQTACTLSTALIMQAFAQSPPTLLLAQTGHERELMAALLALYRWATPQHRALRLSVQRSTPSACRLRCA